MNKLPENVKIPYGYRLIKNGEIIPINSLFYSRSLSRWLESNDFRLTQDEYSIVRVCPIELPEGYRLVGENEKVLYIDCFWSFEKKFDRERHNDYNGWAPSIGNGYKGYKEKEWTPREVIDSPLYKTEEEKKFIVIRKIENMNTQKAEQWVKIDDLKPVDNTRPLHIFDGKKVRTWNVDWNPNSCFQNITHWKYGETIEPPFETTEEKLLKRCKNWIKKQGYCSAQQEGVAEKSWLAGYKEAEEEFDDVPF